MLPGAPVFLVHQTYRGRAALPQVAAARTADRRSPPGVLLDFGAVHLRGVRDDARQRGLLTPLLADGATYACPSKQGVPMAPWVQRTSPTSRAEWDATINDAFAEQRNLGVDALSIPGVELASSSYPNEFERQVDAIRRAWRSRAAGDPPFLARVSLHDDWLRDVVMRRFLLNQLTDLPEPIGIGLHVRFARRDAAGDVPSLTALREVVRVLANDGRRVVTLQSGMVGWLSLAWGAWGFSAGMSQGSWLDSREMIRRRAGQRAPARLERYFEPQILHQVLSSDHARLAAHGDHRQCACTFCRQLSTGWNPTAAAQHDLYALAELTQRVAVGDRTAIRDEVRRLVEDAQTQWALWKSTQNLSARARPTQLPAWRSVV